MTALEAMAEPLMRLTRRESLADFFITPPLTLALAVVSLRTTFSAWWVPEFAAGLLAWTAYEYAVHRWVSHGMPVLRHLHWLHHRAQRDYIALHPAITIVLYALLWMTFGLRSSAAAIGFSTGYVAYAALHTAFHYTRIREHHPLYAARRRHVIHHRTGDRCYGVTTGVWDALLGTE